MELNTYKSELIGNLNKEKLMQPQVADEQADLDSDLDELAQQVWEAKKEVEEKEIAEQAATAVNAQQQIHNEILALLSRSPNAPTSEHVAQWKEKYGENAVYVLGLGPGDVYVYTALTLGQWEKIQTIVQQAQGTPQAEHIEKAMREKVIRATTLWPQLSKEFFQTCRAGVPDTLYQAILLNSYFLTPQQTMTLSVQL